METFQDIMENYDSSLNTSKNFLTKFERSKIIGTRMEQLARGAIPFVNVSGLTNIKQIALKELHEKKTPFIVSRTMPNGKREYFKLSDMIFTTI